MDITFNSVPVEAFRYIGGIGLLIVVLISYFVIRYEPKGVHVSLSAHAASSKLQSRLLSYGLTLGGALFYSYVYFWLGPAYALPDVLIPTFVIAFIAQLIVAVFPVNNERNFSHRLHLLGGSIIAVMMLICLVALALSKQLMHDSLGFFVILATIAYSIVSISLYLSTSNRRRYFLVFESTYIAAFMLSILTVTLRI